MSLTTSSAKTSPSADGPSVVLSAVRGRAYSMTSASASATLSMNSFSREGRREIVTPLARPALVRIAPLQIHRFAG